MEESKTAKTCWVCGRIYPADSAMVAQYDGERYICDDCDHSNYPGENDYDEDEYDYGEDSWIERHISETTFARYLARDETGKYFFHEVSAYKLEGQDWGMTPDHQWDNEEFPMLDARRPFLHCVLHAIRHHVIKPLKPGEECRITFIDDDDYWDYVCPVCDEYVDGSQCANCGADFSEE